MQACCVSGARSSSLRGRRFLPKTGAQIRVHPATSQPASRPRWSLTALARYPGSTSPRRLRLAPRATEPRRAADRPPGSERPAGGHLVRRPARGFGDGDRGHRHVARSRIGARVRRAGAAHLRRQRRRHRVTPPLGGRDTEPSRVPSASVRVGRNPGFRGGIRIRWRGPRARGRAGVHPDHSGDASTRSFSSVASKFQGIQSPGVSAKRWWCRWSATR